MIDIKVGDLPLNRGSFKVLDTEGLLDSTGFEVPSVERLRHGALAGLGRATGRTIKISGRVETRSAADQMQARNKLMGLFRSGTSSPLVWMNGDLELNTDVKLIDKIVFQPKSVFFATWEMSMYSEDAFYQGPVRTSYSFPVGTGIALAYPLFGVSGVLTYGSVIDADQSVTNYGTETSYPLMIVYGDLPGGFKVTTKGKTILWPWPVVPTQPVEIDHTGTIRVGGANLTHMARKRQWMPLDPGQTYAPKLYALQDGEGYIETQQRDTYL